MSAGEMFFQIMLSIGSIYYSDGRKDCGIEILEVGLPAIA